MAGLADAVVINAVVMRKFITELLPGLPVSVRIRCSGDWVMHAQGQAQLQGKECGHGS
ncbi:MAG: hypothetical protein ABI564_17790 [Ideonella sp.]